MASLTIPITVSQLLELARQLAPDERRTLPDTLLAERFDTALCNRTSGAERSLN